MNARIEPVKIDAFQCPSGVPLDGEINARAVRRKLRRFRRTRNPVRVPARCRDPINSGLRAIAAHNLVRPRSEEHTSELQSLMRISYAVFCLKKKLTNI